MTSMLDLELAVEALREDVAEMRAISTTYKIQSDLKERLDEIKLAQEELKLSALEREDQVQRQEDLLDLKLVQERAKASRAERAEEANVLQGEAKASRAERLEEAKTAMEEAKLRAALKEEEQASQAEVWGLKVLAGVLSLGLLLGGAGVAARHSKA